MKHLLLLACSVGIIASGVLGSFRKDANQRKTFGVITDTHGHGENAQYFAQQFTKRGVDGIILTGDIADRMSWITGDGKGENVIRILAKTGLPIYVLPGNHDPRLYYEPAIATLRKQHPNIIDLLSCRKIDGIGFDFVSNPYGIGRSYYLSGYYASEKTYAELEQLLTHGDDPLLLITHQPPKCPGRYGTDYTMEGSNDGDPRLDEIMRQHKVHFSLSGHIHSATNGCDADGNRMREKAPAASLRLNPGAALPHMTRTGKYSAGKAAIIILEKKHMQYELLEKPLF
ncbi:metallophosphoesterase [Candidatus Woesearchaeota archaeon]|nr:metallophosphoesterase [Candidatus Woesearchaeota archaeon]